MRKLLEAENVSVNYDGFEALKDVSLSICEKDFISILGPNGSGKTTLIRALTGLIKPVRGKVMLHGKPVHSYKRKEFARYVSFLPQNPSITLPFLVKDIVMMGRFPYLGRFDIERGSDLDAVEEAMRIMNIHSLTKRHLMELSGGEMRRVFIAQAIAQQSDVLFLDEPTANLDINYQLEIFKLLKNFNEQMKKTVVLITHDINHAARYAKRIVLLKDGKIFRIGSAEEIVNNKDLSEVFNTDIFIEKDKHNKPYILI